MTARLHVWITGRSRPRRMTLEEFRQASRDLARDINGLADDCRDRVVDMVTGRQAGRRAELAREIQPIGEPVFTTLRRERS